MNIPHINFSISEGSTRSVKAKKNIISLFFIKGGSIGVNLLLVPLTLNYVDSETYGIWLTLSSMVTWMSFFDIGINNGLKNKLAEALALKDYELGKKYVSTTYAILSIIFIPLMITGLLVCPYIDWQALLNIDTRQIKGFLTAIYIIISYFAIQFILSTVNVVLLADQCPADSSLRTLIQNLLSLVIIWILTLITKGSLVNLCIALCVAPIFVLLLFNLTLFSGRYRKISPSFSSIDFSVTPVLLKLGVQFFIIQIAAIIQFQMMNFIILRYYGATEVTAYTIAHKYFNIVYMLWGILLTPLWAATTDAITKGDILWVINCVRKYLRFFVLFSILSVFLLLVSEIIYHFWIGDTVNIPFWLSFWTMAYFVVLMFGSTFVTILNGAGILKTQTLACIISPFVFLTLCYYLIHCGLGVFSVLIASIVANFNGFLLAPIQYYMLVAQKK